MLVLRQAASAARLAPVALALALLLGASAATAIQFTPPTSARLHTQGSGEPGAEWTTSGLGSGGQLSYDQGTQTLTLTGVLDVLNYYDTGVGSTCPTDAGSNCSFNYSPDLDFTLEASFDGLVVTDLGGGFYNIQANFGTSGGVDLTLVDPTDNTTVLEAAVAAGTFQGTPTTGLSAAVVFDSNTNSVAGGLTVVNGLAFLEVDQGSPYAGLFDPDYFGLAFATLEDFSDGLGGDLDDIVAATYAAGDLVDFTAEGNGQVFALQSGQFVPEPSALLLLAAAGAALALRARRI